MTLWKIRTPFSGTESVGELPSPSSGLACSLETQFPCSILVLQSPLWSAQLKCVRQKCFPFCPTIHFCRQRPFARAVNANGLISTTVLPPQGCPRWTSSVAFPVMQSWLETKRILAGNPLFKKNLKLILILLKGKGVSHVSGHCIAGQVLWWKSCMAGRPVSKNSHVVQGGFMRSKKKKLFNFAGKFSRTGLFAKKRAVENFELPKVFLKQNNFAFALSCKKLHSKVRRRAALQHAPWRSRNFTL